MNRLLDPLSRVGTMTWSWKALATIELVHHKIIIIIIVVVVVVRRWEGMDFKEIGINMRIWIDSAQDRDYWRALMNAALNLRVP